MGLSASEQSWPSRATEWVCRGGKWVGSMGTTLKGAHHGAIVFERGRAGILQVWSCHAGSPLWVCFFEPWDPFDEEAVYTPSHRHGVFCRATGRDWVAVIFGGASRFEFDNLGDRHGPSLQGRARRTGCAGKRQPGRGSVDMRRPD